MTEYKQYIRSLADQDRNVVFYNADEHHGAFVMGTMFEKANKNIKLFSGCFSGDISGKQEYKKGLEMFLRGGGKLQILLEKDTYEKYKREENGEPKIFDLLRMYAFLNKNQVQIKLHSFSVRNKETNREMHFMVADDKMYRIEDDTEKFSATGNFNDIKRSSELKNIFDGIFNDVESTLVEL
jgi:hypothetical protein